MPDIILKLKKSELTGRGGAGFPVWLKWKMVKNARAGQKYIVCNASEGEPGVKKDSYILNHYPQKIITGIKTAIDFFGGAKKTKAFIYLSPKYYPKLASGLSSLVGSAPIKIFKKQIRAGYIGGEETSAINHIEGRRIEPRLRPPFPPTNGLWGKPTLVNNVETFYAVSQIAAGRYRRERFYTIGGQCRRPGIYCLPENWDIKKILKKTGNYPRLNFFVQIGGAASGEVLNSRQLNGKVGGAGSITIYNLTEHKPIDLMRSWVGFFKKESCGQCTPCREGTYRLWEILNSPNPNWTMFYALVNNLAETAFCGLGGAVPLPLRSYLKNVWPKQKKLP